MYKFLIDYVNVVVDVLGCLLVEGCKVVLMIVGCDISEMDEFVVFCVVIESVVENFSDGIIVLVFWFVILGLFGLLIYKIMNIVDSMIGYWISCY